MNIANLRGGVGETKLKDTIRKLNSKRRRIDFLNECLAEKVVPNSAPKHLKEVADLSKQVLRLGSRRASEK